jgi:hypothetical protein
MRERALRPEAVEAPEGKCENVLATLASRPIVSIGVVSQMEMELRYDGAEGPLSRGRLGAISLEGKRAKRCASAKGQDE